MGWAAAGITAIVGGYGLFKAARIGEQNKTAEAEDAAHEQDLANRRVAQHERDFGSTQEAAAASRKAADDLQESRNHEESLRRKASRGLWKRFWAWGDGKKGNAVSHLVEKYDTDGVDGFKSANAREIEREQLRQKVDERERNRQDRNIQRDFHAVDEHQLRASQLRNEGKTAEAQREEIEAAVELERRRMEGVLPKGIPHRQKQIDGAAATKRKELEDGALIEWQLRGGEESLRATQLRAQGKPEEAFKEEMKALRKRTYQEALEHFHGHKDKANAEADAAVAQASKEGFRNWQLRGGEESLRATQLHAQGKPEEAFEEEMKALRKRTYQAAMENHHDKDKANAEADAAVAQASKEGFQNWQLRGGEESLHATQLRAEGKTAEAHQEEIAALRKRTYQAAMENHHDKNKANAEADAAVNEAENAGYEEWRQHGGREGMLALEAHNRGDIRGFHQHQDMSNWWRYYQDAMSQFGNNNDHAAEAKALADDKLFGDQRERAMDAAHLVDARTSHLQAMRIAAIAMDPRHGGDAAMLSKIHHELAKHTHIGREAADTAWRKKFPKAGQHS
jgi:hypothetical protein